MSISTNGTAGASVDTPLDDVPVDQQAPSAVDARRSRRDFRLYWLAGAANQLGSHSSALVLPLLVLGIGETPAMAGLLGTVAVAGKLLVGPGAGVLADRWPRKRVMVAAAMVSAVAMATVVAAISVGRVHMAQLFAVAIVMSVSNGFYEAAALGTVRRILPADAYPGAVAQLEARDHGVRLVAPTLGGALYQLARSVPFLLDAVSYVVAALCVRSMRTDLTAARPDGEPTPSLWTDAKAGWNFVWAQPLLRFVTLWAACVNFVFAALYYHAVLAFRLDGAGAAAIGTILTIASVGGLVGALLAPRLLRHVRLGALVIGASWLMAALVGAMAFTDQVWVYGLLFGGVFLVTPVLAVVFQSRAIVLIPDHLQGRAGMVMGTFGEAVAVFAPVTAGVAIASLGPAPLALGFAAVLAILAVVTTAVRRLFTAPAAEAEELRHG